VGQSGSGKSSFVTRLIEEILLRTNARIVALDPDGDLKDVNRIDLDGTEDIQTRRQTGGRLSDLAGLTDYDTDTKGYFRTAWPGKKITFLEPNPSNPPDRPDPSDLSAAFKRRQLLIKWTEVDEGLRERLISAQTRDDMSLLIGARAAEKRAVASKPNSPEAAESFDELMQAAKDLMSQSTGHPEVQHFAEADWARVLGRFQRLKEEFNVWWGWPKDTGITTLASHLGVAFEKEPEEERNDNRNWNALVIGLDHVQKDQDAVLTASVVLDRLWESARSSLLDYPPIFIVIDEAHRFAPATSKDPLRRHTTDSILRIASEGRKYGLFLILATQRPMKLHPELVSECENSAVLRLQSEGERKFAADRLGLPIEDADQVRRYAQGEVLLGGRWVDAVMPRVLALPIRTKVGGGGKTDDWTVVPSPSPIPSSPDLAFSDPRDDGMYVPSSEPEEPIKPTVSLTTSQKSQKREACRKQVEQTLQNSPTPVFQSALGIELARAGLGNYSEYSDMPTLEPLLKTFGIEGLTLVWPYVYLASIHTPPPQEDDGSSPVPETVGKVRLYIKQFPNLSESQFASVFLAISDDLCRSGYSFLDTSENVRDLLWSRGMAISRQAVQFVLRGIDASGHSFGPDEEQGAKNLAEAFITYLESFLRDLPDDQKSAVRAFVKGGLDPDQRLVTGNRLKDQVFRLRQRRDYVGIFTFLIPELRSLRDGDLTLEDETRLTQELATALRRYDYDDLERQVVKKFLERYPNESWFTDRLKELTAEGTV